ncbi:LamG-like jellyroll fold domain-containing protein [Desulfolutivibrio sulfodismutans]|nr:LamG-like jellyroll fold domain-containing protein [Desulfolutivibrio sulfodismutans]
MTRFRTRAVAYWGDLPGVVRDVNALTGAVSAHVQGALAAGGSGITAASATSLMVGTGARTLTISTGKGLVAGQYVVLWTEAGQAGMLGRVTAYNTVTGSLTVDVADTVGAGTYAVWAVFVVPLVAAQVDLSGGHFTAAPVSVGGVARRLRDDVGQFVGVVPPAFQIFAPDLALPGTVAFSRASSAWRLGAAGSLREAAVGVPRFDYDASGNLLGLRIEGAATRLNTIAAAPTAPENVSVSAVAYTVSYYGGGSLTLSGAYSGAIPPIEGIGYNVRRSLTFTPTAGTLTLAPSGTVQHLQVEAGPFATSPILGEGSAVARAADVATVALSDIDFNAAEGTIYCEFRVAGVSVPQRIFYLDNNGNTNVLSLFVSASNKITMAVNSGGTAVVYTEASLTVAVNTVYRAAFSFRNNNYQLVVNGGQAVSDTSGAMPSPLSTLRVGHTLGGVQPMCGALRHFTYFPRALTAAQLRAITL